MAITRTFWFESINTSTHILKLSILR